MLDMLIEVNFLLKNTNEMLDVGMFLVNAMSESVVPTYVNDLRV